MLVQMRVRNELTALSRLVWPAARFAILRLANSAIHDSASLTYLADATRISMCNRGRCELELTHEVIEGILHENVVFDLLPEPKGTPAVL